MTETARKHKKYQRRQGPESILFVLWDRFSLENQAKTKYGLSMFKYDFGPNVYFYNEILILKFYRDFQVSFVHNKYKGLERFDI